MFYKELLRAQIPKAQKTLVTWLSFAILGSVKALQKHIGEIDPCWVMEVGKHLERLNGLISLIRAVFPNPFFGSRHP